MLRPERVCLATHSRVRERHWLRKYKEGLNLAPEISFILQFKTASVLSLEVQMSSHIPNAIQYISTLATTINGISIAISHEEYKRN